MRRTSATLAVAAVTMVIVGWANPATAEIQASCSIDEGGVVTVVPNGGFAGLVVRWEGELRLVESANQDYETCAPLAEVHSIRFVGTAGDDVFGLGFDDYGALFGDGSPGPLLNVPVRVLGGTGNDYLQTGTFAAPLDVTATTTRAFRSGPTGSAAVVSLDGVEQVDFASIQHPVAGHRADHLDLRKFGVPSGLFGFGGADVLFGSRVDDAFLMSEDAAAARADGGPGNDRFVGGPEDVASGGPGDDLFDKVTVSFASAPNAVIVDLSARTATGEGQDGFTGPQNNTIIGSRFGDLLLGSFTDDILRGGKGDDTIDAGFGHDTLDGGPGLDDCTADPTDADTFTGCEP